jgi:hypothetical protein
MASSESRNSFLRPSKYETVCCDLRITKMFLCPTHHGTVSRGSRIMIDRMLFAAQTSFMLCLILVGHELVLIIKYWLQGTNKPPRHIQQSFVLTSSQISIKQMTVYTEYLKYVYVQIPDLTNSVSRCPLEADGVCLLKK